MSRLPDSPSNVVAATATRVARELSDRSRRSPGIAPQAEPFSRAVTREVATMAAARPTARPAAPRPANPEPAAEDRASSAGRSSRPAHPTRDGTTDGRTPCCPRAGT